MVEAVERERLDSKTVGGVVAAVKPWAWQSCGGHSWDLVSVVWVLTSGQ
jgi:hypothetical protein